MVFVCAEVVFICAEVVVFIAVELEGLFMLVSLGAFFWSKLVESDCLLRAIWFVAGGQIYLFLVVHAMSAKLE